MTRLLAGRDTAESRSAGQRTDTGYPAELSREITTRTGRRIQLRAIRPDDGPKLVAFHQHLSARSVYRRYLSLHASLSPVEVEHFVCVDYVDRMAFVAEDDQQLIAVGRYEGSPGSSEAEVAFVVADDYQNLGIGSHLLEQLADAAWGRGITTFVALTLTENREMLGVFLHSGYDVKTSAEDGVTSIRFSIGPPDDMERTVRAISAT